MKFVQVGGIYASKCAVTDLCGIALNFPVLRVAGNGENDPHLNDLQDQRGSAVAEERERNARVGHGIGNHGNVQDHL